MPAAEGLTQELQEQRTYAGLAGILFLGAILLATGGSLIASRIAGDGTFAETAARLAASEHLYRAALSVVLVVTISSILLAFALYVTLKPVSSRLAQLALIFSLADSFLAFVVRMCSFARLHLYLSAQAGAEPLSELLRTVAGTTENIGILFGIGSCVFFYLFFKLSYIPRIISVLGVIASGIWTALYFAGLIFPEHHALFQETCFPPMLLAEVLTGLYLVLFAVHLEPASSAARA